MPVLGPDDALPVPPRRVLVAGAPGAGKTVLAGRIGERLHLPFTEIDALFHGPDWTPRESFRAEVDEATAGAGWVIEWMYTEVRDLLAQRADTLVWLDLPRATVMRRLVVRTVRRRWQRTTLWNGNVEPPLIGVLTDQDHIVRWGWRTHPKIGPRVTALAEARPELLVVRLRRPREVRRWLDGPLRDRSTPDGLTGGAAPPR